MEKILDINGIITDVCGEYTDENCWIGRIILRLDNSFEGVAEKLFSNEKYFLFGHLDSEHIDFILGNNEEDEVPKRLDAYLDDGFFAGPFYAKDIYNEIPLGECRVRVNPADQIRETSDYEMVIVKNEIKNQKENLGERTKGLYEEFQNNKNKEKKLGQK